MLLHLFSALRDTDYLGIAIYKLGFIIFHIAFPLRDGICYFPTRPGQKPTHFPEQCRKKKSLSGELFLALSSQQAIIFFLFITEIMH